MNRHFYWQSEGQARFLTIGDQGMDVLLLQAVLGELRKQEQHQAMTMPELLENISRAEQHGFIEVSQAEFSKLRTDIEGQLLNGIEDEIPLVAQVVDWSDLAATLQHYFLNSPDEYLAERLRKFCQFDEHHHSCQDITLKFNSLGSTTQHANRNLIFNGGLCIDGNLDAGDMTTELPLFVLVKGDLKAHNILLSGWAEVVVTGNVNVNGTIFGYDGEAGGRLNVLGDLTAIHILNGQFPIRVGGNLVASCWTLGQDENAIPGSNQIPTEFPAVHGRDISTLTPLVDDVYVEDSNWATGEERISYVFDASLAMEVMRRRNSLFRE
ncbi:MAG: hypothetical protein KDB03_17890 [Planctomycetales bacterium]|nr:hypothetical protein [Planctomycetales bacterium]